MLCSVKYSVGLWGKWDMMRASGVPLLMQDYKVHDIIGAARSGKLFDDVCATIT